MQEGKRDAPQPVSISQGFSNFVSVELRAHDGKVLYSSSLDFCPDVGPPFRIRLTPTAPRQTAFPWSCGYAFTTRSMWGVEKNTGVAIDFSVPPVTKARTLVITINASSQVRESNRTDDRLILPLPLRAGVWTTNPSFRYLGAMKPIRVMQRSQPIRGLPNLVPMPPSNLSLVRDGKRDLLMFDSVIANLGRTPLLITGRRRQNEMTARQILPSGSRPVGDLVFDRGEGHHHWHLPRLALYTLLNKRTGERSIAKKVGFCLGPGVPVDLLLPAAPFTPGSFRDYCNGGSATRMDLPVGWGDLYASGYAGQFFDITDLANGAYNLTIAVNPTRTLSESVLGDDSVTRVITLGGIRGHRTLSAPSVRGVDRVSITFES